MPGKRCPMRIGLRLGIGSHTRSLTCQAQFHHPDAEPARLVGASPLQGIKPEVGAGPRTSCIDLDVDNITAQ